MKRRGAPLLAAALLAACGFHPQKLFEPVSHIEVREVARQLDCHTPGAAAQARLLAGAAAVRSWQQARGVDFAVPLADATYAVVEAGAHPTGGYSVAVSRSAVLRGELVILYATFIAPAADALAPQMLTAPCVLVQLPAGRYATIEVQDENGTPRATGSAAEPAAAPRREPPAE